MDSVIRRSAALISGSPWTPLEVHVKKDEEAEPESTQKPILRTLEEEANVNHQALIGLGSFARGIKTSRSVSRRRNEGRKYFSPRTAIQLTMISSIAVFVPILCFPLEFGGVYAFCRFQFSYLIIS